MATTGDLMGLIGREGYVTGTIGTVKFDVIVLDAKHVYGDTRVLVTPKSGEGSGWVSLSRMVLNPRGLNTGERVSNA
jgi:hypothetical protein